METSTLVKPLQVSGTSHAQASVRPLAVDRPSVNCQCGASIVLPDPQQWPDHDHHSQCTQCGAFIGAVVLRLTVEETRGSLYHKQAFFHLLNNPDSCTVQMRRMAFFGASGQLHVRAVTSDPCGAASDGVENLVLQDPQVNDKTSAWQSSPLGQPIYFYFDGLQTPTSYRWITSHDRPLRDAVSWRLEGSASIGAPSDPDHQWMILDVQEGYPVPYSRETPVCSSLPILGRHVPSVGGRLPRDPTLSGVRYEAFSESVANVFGDDDGILTLSTYKIHLKGVSEVFGDRLCTWATRYPPAKAIFGKGLLGLPSFLGIPKQMVRELHGALYNKKTRWYLTGLLTSADAFLRLVNYGRRNGTRRDFTYVLKDQALSFSETSAAFFKDKMSKHAVHSNASKQVRYSGEMCLAPDVAHSNRWTLIIDNNSGTYTPDKNMLPLIVQLFKRNFPDLQVIGYDYKDPAVKAWHEGDVPLNVTASTLKLISSDDIQRDATSELS